jgi:hypothetical protein
LELARLIIGISGVGVFRKLAKRVGILVYAGGDRQVSV